MAALTTSHLLVALGDVVMKRNDTPDCWGSGGTGGGAERRMGRAVSLKSTVNYTAAEAHENTDPSKKNSSKSFHTLKDTTQDEAEVLRLTPSKKESTQRK